MEIGEDLAAASATPFVLAVLCEDDSYGYAIVKRVRELAEKDQFEWGDALIYPLFHRLRRMGYLTSEWRALPEGQRRRFYAITDDGRSVLTARRNRGASAQDGRGRAEAGIGWLLVARRDSS